MRKSIAGLSLLVCLGSGAVLADTTGGVSSSDKKFLTEAASGGMLEVQLGQYAASHAVAQDAKDFGQHMDTDHSKANEELLALAKSKGVEITGVMSSKDQKSLEKLEKKEGEEFDKAYISAMVKDHENDISEFEKEAKTGDDADIKAFAEKTLPTLQHHLEMAKAAKEKLK